ncbi:MAG: hypothetical protein ACJ79U_12260 [Myxococcales bacterium]
MSCGSISAIAKCRSCSSVAGTPRATPSSTCRARSSSWRAISSITRSRQIPETALKNLPVASWRGQFAGTDKDNGDWFDQSFGGLLKAASNQISIR